MQGPIETVKIKELPSQEYLKECFEYDPEVGVLIWKTRPLSHFSEEKTGKIFNTQWAGKPAGFIKKCGYLYTSINDNRFSNHRIIWKLVTGKDPKVHIDHKNGDTACNKWKNLREANRSENNRSRRKNKNNSSGYKGVSFNIGRMMYVAKIGFNRKRIHLGYFDSPKDAYAAYCDAAKRLHKDFAKVA